MMAIDGLLKQQDFDVPHTVQGCKTVTHLFPDENKRRGVYALHLADESGNETLYYIGQTDDITRRYQEHRANYPDILRLSFQRVRKNALKEREKFIIKELERQGVSLLNIIHTHIPSSSSPFDVLMPPQEQQRWLTDGHVVVGVPHWYDALGTLPDGPRPLRSGCIWCGRCILFVPCRQASQRMVGNRPQRWLRGSRTGYGR